MGVTMKRVLALGLFINFCLLYLYNASLPSISNTFLGFYSEPTIGVFEDAPSIPWDESEPWQNYIEKLTLTTKHQNFINENNYCEKVAEYQKENPVKLDSRGVPLKESRNIFSDYSSGLLVKKILTEYVNLYHLKHTTGMKSEEVPMEKLSPEINFFFELSPDWHKKHEIGVHFLCEGQRYNHIPGNSWLNFKDVTANSMREYQKHYESRENCFEPWTITPETLDLTNTEECSQFLEIMKKEKNEKRIEWMIKKSRYSHNGKGVWIVDPEKREEILRTYECPFEEKYLAEKYIENPFLINNKKFDFRAYLLIASMDPLIILYHDGFVKISIENYDPESQDLSTHLTNTKVLENSVKSLNITKAEKEALLADHSWSFEHFEKYMMSTGIVKENWLEEEVRKYLKNTMFHLVRMHLDKLLKHPQVFELYGLDFLMDEDLNLWFLETNLTPAIGSTSEEKKEVNTNLVLDMVNLEYAIMYGGDVDQIVENSNFHWIFDGRLKGFDRYKNTITPDCVELKAF